MKRANIVRRTMLRASITVRSMEQRAVEKARELWKDEQGIGVVEVILILVVLIGLVIIFKSQLTSLVNTIFRKITSESSGI